MYELIWQARASLAGPRSARALAGERGPVDNRGLPHATFAAASVPGRIADRASSSLAAGRVNPGQVHSRTTRVPRARRRPIEPLRLQPVVRPATQADVVHGERAADGPSQDVIELEESSRVAASSVLRDVRALAAVAQVDGA